MSIHDREANLGFPFLLVHAAELPVEYLQLDLSTSGALRRRGVRSIADLIEIVGSESCATRECKIALSALEDLAQACEATGVDWYRYWKRRNFDFNHMRLTCTELDRFVEGSADCAVNKVNFGNAGVMLGRAGFRTISELCEGLRVGIGDIPWFGAKKKEEFFKYLILFVKDLRKGKTSPQELAEKFPVSDEKPGFQQNSARYDLHESVLRLGIGVLHAGPKTKLLEGAGYKTVGDVARAGSGSLLSLSGIGKSVLARIEHSLNALNEAQTSSGSIDWDEYCLKLGIPLLPVERVSMDGNSFTAMVATTIGQLGRTLDSPVLQKIILQRISEPPHRRATHEEIGSSLAPPVTRERIRQREAKLVEALAAALVHDDYSHMDVHFRPEFSSYWKRAAEHFSDAGEDITFDSLADGLSMTWGADEGVLYEHLPLIATVITGEVMSDTSFGNAARLDPRLRSLPEATKAIPLRSLQIGRSARALRSRGIETVGDLVRRIIRGEVSRASGVHYRAAMDNLEAVAETLDPDQGIDWERYLEITQTRSLPTRSAQGAAGFFNNLQASVCELLEANAPRMRSREIFELRTGRPMTTRMTIYQVAAVLKAHPSSVKMEETYTLAYLNDVILEGDHSLASVHLSADFTRMWDRINEVFDEAGGDAELFQRYLAAAFGIPEAEVEPAMPTMIAVLTGYPYGRSSKKEPARHR